MALTTWANAARDVRALGVMMLLATGCGGGNTTSDAASNPDGGTGDGGTMPGSDAGRDAGSAGGHDFATATSVTVDPSATTSATLADADTTRDFYTFAGVAGDRILIAANARSLLAATVDDDTVVDTVVTLYDASMTQIARNDDAFPRTSTDSALYTVLPSTGTYYFVVEGCQSAYATGCADAALVTMFHYEVFVAHVSNLVGSEFHAAATQDGTTAMAAAVTYAIPTGGTPGEYGMVTLDGSLDTTASTQVFSFTPPADTSVTAGQVAHAEFWVQGNTTAGNGSTANLHVWVTDADGTTVIADETQADYGTGSAAGDPPHVSVPVLLGHQYYLFVRNAAATSTPTTDFYFVRHYVGNYYYGTAELEASAGANDTMVTAQALTSPTGASTSFFATAGTIATATDEDWYDITVPAGDAHASLSCDAQRVGSGLRGLTAVLTNTTGTPVTGSSITETATLDAATSAPVALPAGTTHVLLHVRTGSQSAAVTSSYYSCYVTTAP